MVRTIFRLAVALSALAALPAAGHAQQPAQQRQPLVITMQNRTAANEAAAGRRRADDRAHPGDVLRYRLAFTNPSRGALRGVVLSDPVPSGMQYVDGSATTARTDARLEFSADGGRTWSPRPMETVTVNGASERRAVPAGRYTHVRWTLDGTVAPGATVVAEFDARVTAGAQSPSASPQAGR